MEFDMRRRQMIFNTILMEYTHTRSSSEFNCFGSDFNIETWYRKMVLITLKIDKLDRFDANEVDMK